MKVSALLFVPAMVLVGCASAPPDPAESEARLMPASYVEPAAAEVAAPTTEVCKPRVVEQRAIMNESCLNVVTYSPAVGKVYNAVGREKKEAHNLCDNIALPRCRSVR